MFEQLLQNYIEDLTVQGVALCLQVNSFTEGKAKNPILRTIILEEINSEEITQMFRQEFNVLRKIETLEELSFLTYKWLREKLNIQYGIDNYGYGEDRKSNIAKVYCYVFFLRCLRKRHKELWKMCQQFTATTGASLTPNSL